MIAATMFSRPPSFIGVVLTAVVYMQSCMYSFLSDLSSSTLPLDEHLLTVLKPSKQAVHVVAQSFLSPVWSSIAFHMCGSVPTLSTVVAYPALAFVYVDSIVPDLSDMHRIPESPWLKHCGVASS